MMTFIETHKKIFIIQNIKEDFHDIEIHSFLSSKILNHVSRSEILESKISLSVFIIIISFIEIVLINSSLNINIVMKSYISLDRIVLMSQMIS